GGWRLSATDRTEDAAGIAGGDDVGGDVSGDDAPCGDHGAVADPHAREKDGASANPDVLANVHGLSGSHLPPQGSIDGMDGGVDLHRRAEEAVAADAHPAYVQEDAAEVEIDALAELDVRSVVAVEGRLQPNAVAASAEEFFGNPSSFRLVGSTRLQGFQAGVQTRAELPCPRACGDQLGVDGVVGLPGEHVLPLRTHLSSTR